MASSSRAKGNRNQRKCIEYLEQKGYLVDKVEKTGKFAKIKDLFGLYDLIALKKNLVVFVQVTTNRPHVHKKYMEFSKKYPCVKHQQFVWYDRKGWKIFTYKEGKKKVENIGTANIKN